MEKSKYFEVISEYKFMAKHEVGQNFLADPKAAEAIVDLADIQSEERVLEIGSGAGSLSYFLSLKNNDIDLIDIDEAFVKKLQDDFVGRNNIHPLKANAMKFDFSLYNKIIGNLPYYITSGIVERFLLNGKNCAKAVFMVQKEAFFRLVSPKGSADYSPLGILLSYLYSAQKEFLVPRTSFVPAPHVDSLVFTLSRKENVSQDTATRLYKLTSGLFAHRRKTILNNLSAFLGDKNKAASALKEAKISLLDRPEDISLEGYLSLLSIEFGRFFLN